MLAYRKKQKESKFPIWTCPDCKESINLDFNPIKEKIKWLTFECPKCKYNRINEID